eukprot:TRINITY_DN3684_c1_g1_i2.p1 TRINITY_DN3684_c1_g1~~TRINITY_DN3684_c1_g1_i2.p1  ORF type:complete len:594 (+),score=195.31 TRINITY_DN3684_c1_g1_i2:86-1867(+)
MSGNGENSKNNKTIMRSGWMFKKGEIIPSWKRRWFVLDGMEIRYYLSSSALKKEQQGTITLFNPDSNQYVKTIIISRNQKAHHNLFALGFEGQRFYLCSPESSSMRQEWIEAIHDVINVHKSSNPRYSTFSPLALSPATSPPPSNSNRKDTKPEESSEESFKIDSFPPELAKNLQFLIRSHLERKRFLETRRKITKLQAIWRGERSRRQTKSLFSIYKRRFKIAQELYNTEQSYVGSLQLLLEMFVKPLLEDSNILTQDQTRIMFSNVEHLVILHSHLLSKLQERMDRWYPQQRFGDIFCDKINDFKTFYAQYVTNYEKSLAMIKNCETSIPSFSVFLNDVSKDSRCNSLNLQDFLIMPVQRLPRYEMLLNDLAKNSPVGIVDKSELERAVNGLRESNSFVNKYTQEQHSKERIRNVKDKTKGKEGKMLYQPGRELIREGYLFRVGTDGVDKKMYGFLFNDSFMTSKKVSAGNLTQRYNFKDTISLKGASLALKDPTIIGSQSSRSTLADPIISPPTSPRGSTPEGFKKEGISASPSFLKTVFSGNKAMNAESSLPSFCITDKDGKSFVFRCETANERKGWVNAISSAIKDLE